MTRCGIPKGLTLVELLVVLVIMSLLMAIAYPSYTRFVTRGHQMSTQEFMLEVVAAAEQYRLDAREYPADLADDLGMVVPDRVDTFYAVTIAEQNAATPPRFTVTAAPRAGTRQQGEATLTADNTGVRTPAEEW